MSTQPCLLDRITSETPRPSLVYFEISTDADIKGTTTLYYYIKEVHTIGVKGNCYRYRTIYDLAIKYKDASRRIMLPSASVPYRVRNMKKEYSTSRLRPLNDKELTEFKRLLRDMGVDGYRRSFLD